MATEATLKSIVPERVLKLLGDCIKAGVAEAERKFYVSQSDEDAVTGALGQAITTHLPIASSGTDGDFLFQMESHKIGGKGPKTPENSVGADAIFQVSVIKNEKVIFTKGLPFQAKKNVKLTASTVKEQATKMFRATSTGIIVRYSEDGYSAVDARKFIGDAFQHESRPMARPKKLANVFGDDFLNCLV